MAQSRQALVIGASGAIGGEIARRLLAHGWRVRALHRDPARMRAIEPGLDWVRGDAMNREDVAAATKGAALLVHAANPPRYRNWRALALPMLESTIAAAVSTRALILFPGTIYNYGPDAFPLVGEGWPQRPRTRKGRIRVEMEQQLEQAAAAGARVLIVRAGDFFGPRIGTTRNLWFTEALVRPGAPLRRVVYPGRAEAGHAWAYLPDLAETMVRLAERSDELPAFATFHFRGHSFVRGIEFAEAIARAAPGAALPIRHFPWPLVYLAAPFLAPFREMLEMRYLWHETLLLDNRRLVAFLGQEPHTPLETALGETLAALGCVG